ncbi:MAG: hypothetical protein MNSN_07100 [Minisyncoccus archaeiphilus]|nr:MAG: hypothetical protein MNSN_07100 [Candidatus Parcubacteria bacterium]
MDMENFINENQEMNESMEKLRDILAVLRELNFRVLNEDMLLESLKEETAKAGFPIVRDGVDGIRVSYSEGNGLRIYFTNGFMDDNHPRRLEVEAKLKEEGLI